MYKDKDVMLFNGDCSKVMEKMAEKGIEVDTVLTDIPFNISMKNNFKTMKDRKGRNGIDFGEWDKGFDESILAETVKLIKSGGSFITFLAFEQYSIVKDVLEKEGMILKDRFIWKKTNPMPRNRDRRYISNCELGIWFVKPKEKWIFNRQDEKYQQMVFEYPSESGGGFKRYHPTQKNLKMIKELVKIHSNEGSIVFDPFMGSGTTGVACKSLDRKFIGVEIDEKYYNITKERILSTEKDGEIDVK